jgi:mRNA-degrading endonuclease RelE of RelBE toxin-antitoxin system
VFDVRLSNSGEKAYRKLDKPMKERVKTALLLLSVNPVPSTECDLKKNSRAGRHLQDTDGKLPHRIPGLLERKNYPGCGY